MIHKLLQKAKKDKNISLNELLQLIDEWNTFYNKADQAYWLVNLAERRFIFVSPSCEKICGVPPEAFYRDVEAWKKVIHPEDREKVQKRRSVLWKGSSFEDEYRIIHQQDGTVRWVLDQTFPTFDENGKLAMLSGVVTDITEIRKMREKLLLAEKVYEHVPHAVLITDENGLIQFINPAFTEITGYGAEAIGLSLDFLHSGYYNENFYQTIRKTVIEKGQWRGRLRGRRKNGEVYVQQTTITAIHDEEGRPIFYLFIFSENGETITSLKDDLKLAQEVQKRVLSKPLKTESIDIYGMYVPSEELGGDMYAWYQIDNDRYGIFLMDVMGHGVAASLICMSVRSLLNGVIRKCIYPKEVFHELNKHMRLLYHEDGRMNTYYFTAVYVMVNTKKRFIEYASAGHPPGFLFHKDGLVEELDRGCAPIGLLSYLHVETGKLNYTPGATLVLYSDGVIEEANHSVRANIEMFREKLKSFIHLESRSMIAHMNKMFKEEYQFVDDISLVVAKLH
ncbi:SpoIIE family protein phosphatase [Parageobacillus thermoglucosidasius]|uniref:SpoIIE family protein phosphatase n=2 Tax=Anoxybacillaceae TaxID=3120669 RepID=A0AB38R169_PARTM|nr:SpoIIE family protein phosphatase [Parageobacillus thermoglucosidasius]MED4904610.1 SpoIIE family protein phosphatase [Parageobacillus thermoglucosidasius]MED4915759.1 SpoIIE family protein phosphatase [Parageobacillus thermoglucosidasius]MED4944088.1 SpoIIE family protein phosphatase [Parageobacillus thermoglucosidasius]MED4983885.1 SpoIIE family protein phosphatase [Parageobacillus thermoglucosidasius]RDE28570.1 PAS domain S-box protein [Parageobacillus thermoglucosidasius]